jgi:galactokinase
MTFFALAVPNGLMQSERFTAQIGSRLDLAMYLACAENGQTFRALAGRQGVGTFGGSEDHTQILNAQPGVLSLYQFCPTLLERECPFPSDLSLVVAYSGVEAAKTGSAMEQYNRAARRAQAAVQFHNQAFGTSFQLLRDLADAFGADGARRLQDPGSELAASPRLAELDLPGRFRQFFEEDRRLIPAAVEALERRDYTRLGELIDESHALSRVHLRNIVPEIDALQATARQLGAVAASGFGAGFGGSAFAIVPKGTEELFNQAWQEAYSQRFPQRAAAAQFFQTAVSGRAAELFVHELEH